MIDLKVNFKINFLYIMLIYYKNLVRNMIELLDKEKLGTLQPGTTSFLVKFAITDISNDMVSNIKEKLSNKKLCFEKGCYYYLDVEYDEISEAMVGIIVYLPDSKWPEDKGEQEKLMETYASTFSIICKEIVGSH